MPFTGYRERSRINWGTHEEHPLNNEQITLGAILRIADATERMAENIIQMESSLKWNKARVEKQGIEIRILERRIAGLRGYINRKRKRK